MPDPLESVPDFAGVGRQRFESDIAAQGSVSRLRACLLCACAAESRRMRRELLPAASRYDSIAA